MLAYETRLAEGHWERAETRDVIKGYNLTTLDDLRTLAPGKINEDVVVPVSRIPELVAGVQALSAEFALPIVTFGHAGNGNLHVNILYAPDDPGQDQRAQAALARPLKEGEPWPT